MSQWHRLFPQQGRGQKRRTSLYPPFPTSSRAVAILFPHLETHSPGHPKRAGERIPRRSNARKWDLGAPHPLHLPIRGHSGRQQDPRAGSEGRASLGPATDPEGGEGSTTGPGEKKGPGRVTPPLGRGRLGRGGGPRPRGECEQHLRRGRPRPRVGKGRTQP